MKARVIVTLECNRSCSYCVNKQPGILEQATKIKDWKELAGYEQILITGGEPMLDVERTVRILKEIRSLFPMVTLYLYSASYKVTESSGYFGWWSRVRDFVNGVHYTIHDNATRVDVGEFDAFEQAIQDEDGSETHSFRLGLGSGVEEPIWITPKLWTGGIKRKEWLKDCKVPEGEKLFIV